MAKSTFMQIHGSNDEVLEERSGTRIRAFLAIVKPMHGTAERAEYLEARSLIEDLALKCDSGRDVYWGASDCASVLGFLHSIQPVEGRCFCDDDSRVNATCGFHTLLAFLEEQMWRMAKTARKGKRAA